MSVEDLNTADMFPDTIYLCRFDALNSVAVYSLRVPNRVQASSQCHVHWLLSIVLFYHHHHHHRYHRFLI